MYSAEERISIWNTFNQSHPEPVVRKIGDEITSYTYANFQGVEIAIVEVKDQEHHIRRDLRDATDSIAVDFLLSHRKG